VFFFFFLGKEVYRNRSIRFIFGRLCFGGGFLLLVLDILIAIEHDEENQKRKNDTFAKHIHPQRTRALIALNQFQDEPVERNADVDDKLIDLNRSDVFLPPGSEAECHQRVVQVHDDMYSPIGYHSHPLEWETFDYGDIDDSNRGDVMIGVQKEQLTLTKDLKDCIEELVVLGQVEEIVPKLYAAFLGQFLWIAEN